MAATSGPTDANVSDRGDGDDFVAQPKPLPATGLPCTWPAMGGIIDYEAEMAEVKEMKSTGMDIFLEDE
jgi:hypothetical protein